MHLLGPPSRRRAAEVSLGARPAGLVLYIPPIFKSGTKPLRVICALKTFTKRYPYCEMEDTSTILSAEVFISETSARQLRFVAVHQTLSLLRDGGQQRHFERRGFH